MRISKTTDEDIRDINQFLRACNLALEKEKFSWNEPFENYKDFDEEDEDKIEILALRDRIAKNEGVNPVVLDDRILMYEYLRVKFNRGYVFRWDCAMWNLEILLENCADRQKDYLDFAPHIGVVHVLPEQ